MTPEQLVTQLRALGEPTRLEILQLLAEKELCGTDILSRLPLNQPNLSRHLRTLREAGLLEERREGRNAYYHVTDQPLLDQVLALAEASDAGNGAQNMPHGESKRLKPRAARDDEEPASPSIEEWLL